MSDRMGAQAEPARTRLLFKVEGGQQSGLGHVARSVTLAGQLERVGADVVGFLCNEDAPSLRRIRDAGYPVTVMRSPDSLGLREAVDRTSAQGLILDQPGDAVGPIRQLRLERRELFLAALDPPDLGGGAFDVIVNLYDHGTSPRPEQDAAYVEGLQYAVLGARFAACREARRRARGTVRDILVCFGGTDPHGLTPTVVGALGGAVLDDATLHVVVGPGFRGSEAVRKAVDRTPGRLKLHQDVEDMPGLMAGCDLAISGGGTTLMELCCLGCPTIVIAQNEAEKRFASSLDAQGAVRYLGLAGEVMGSRIRREVSRLLRGVALRERLGLRGMSLIDGGGGQRTAAVLLRACEAKLRVARERQQTVTGATSGQRSG